jgi:gluconate 5-dehydrogenase
MQSSPVAPTLSGVHAAAKRKRSKTMTHPLFNLTGKRALITGSGQGIGLSLAQGLASAGARIILNGRNVTRLGEAVGVLHSDGHTADLLPFDVTDHAAARAAVDGYEAAHGPIDILVNNAGIQRRAPLEDYDPADFEALMQTNIASVFHVGQACARHMIARGTGRIINIASIQSALARPTIAPYTMTKGAVANLTKGMATDWGPKGLRVNAIAPGYFDTPMNAALVGDKEFTAWIARRTPAGRWGQLPELRGACIFLASEAASYVNGQVLFVDGGMSACL